MANQPSKDKRMAPWRLPRDLVAAVAAEAELAGVPATELVRVALVEELARRQAARGQAGGYSTVG